MKTNITEQETQEILTELRDGKSQGATARLFRRSVSTINKIARRNGVEPANIRAQNTSNANAVRRYSTDGRLDLIEIEFDKIKELLPGAAKPSQIRELALATAILCDKYRMEIGQATDRKEILAGNEISAVDRLRTMLGLDESEDSSEG